MKQEEVFLNAKWVGAPRERQTAEPGFLFPVLRRQFRFQSVRRAVLRAVGLGFFHACLNGTPVTRDQFLPLTTDFEARDNFPVDEILHGHRLYVPEYDVTALLQPGDNELTIHFGGGWYTNPVDRFCGGLADAKVIYRLTLETEEGCRELVSSEADWIDSSYVTDYNIFCLEQQDYTVPSPDPLPHAVPVRPVETDYLFTDCPADRVERTLTPRLVCRDGDGACYDSGRNCACLPVLRVTAPRGERVTVRFSEECLPDGTPDWKYSQGQKLIIVSDGQPREVRPRFTWFSFRYFRVEGQAEPVGIEVIHSDVAVTSDFRCDNETLNWLYETYLNTQLSNLHGGIPSDCPHLERRGYTGDGQLTCHAVMDMLDARRFYQKWMGDISDCQDVLSGHVQYTAPYFHCGGGPGGWGCAIVEVPYQFYRHYGDLEPMRQLYPQMLRYLSYLDAHSRGDLVIRDKEGDWCLGDWCPPTAVILPAPFVNNYFYIRSVMRMLEMAPLVGKEAEQSLLRQRMEHRKQAMMDAYYNDWDGNFLGCAQGANAFALDIGLGDQRTYDNLVQYYRQLGRYDTGIFGTEIVTRVLFQHGDGALAVRLMTARDRISFEGMRRAGATTLWEYWPDAVGDRSRNHPMFGAVTACLFDELLGIRPTRAGSREVEIRPVLVPQLHSLSGSRTLPAGKVSVCYEITAEQVCAVIRIPENLPAVFCLEGKTYPLQPGENRFEHLSRQKTE